MERATTSNVMPKRDHERDLELDKKIEALRRKNEALMKRYKEVEEDRIKAEEEGMALQSRKGKADDLTITISKSTDQESRVVVTKLSSSGSPAGKGEQDPGPDRGEEGPAQSSGRGHRKQLTVTMAGKKGKRVVSERPENRPGPPDVKSNTDDEEARHAESTGKGKQQSQPAKREPAAVQACVQEQEDKLAEEHPKCQEPEILHASMDLDIPTSQEEQEEYLRWKKEREQIDRERVARHKNAKGQWRRAWDVDKTENMFSDKCLPDRDWGPSSRGGRGARRGQQKAGGDSRSHKRGKDKAAKNVLVMSSKAKGKDRLTGRARRWQAGDDDDGENRQASDTTLEEFLEELDALTDDSREDLKDQDSRAPEEVRDVREDPGAQKKAQTSSPRGSEKKVRFSEELVHTAPAKQTSQGSASPESKGSSKALSPKKNKHGEERPQLPAGKQDDSQDKGGSLSAPPVSQQQVSETEHTKTERRPPSAPSPPPAEKASASLQPVEVYKCSSNGTNTEELIDSSLSVLRMESRETHPIHSTSNDKAREHGKIV